LNTKVVPHLNKHDPPPEMKSWLRPCHRVPPCSRKTH